jgi:hypothetical protein
MLSVSFVAALAPAAPAPAARVRVELVFTGTVPAGIDALIVDEAARVWAPYGVAVSRASGSARAGCDSLVMRVAIVDKPAQDVNDHALGSILFLAAEPTPFISLYAGTASDLVASVASGSMSQWTTSYHDGVMGRVLGRALAHEIGHYLLGTREHSISGLMRAAPRIDELMAVFDPKMILSPQQQAVLRDQTSRRMSSPLPNRVSTVPVVRKPHAR